MLSYQSLDIDIMLPNLSLVTNFNAIFKWLLQSAQQLTIFKKSHLVKEIPFEQI